MSNLTLFLNVKGQEVKKILELEEFKEPIEVELIEIIDNKLAFSTGAILDPNAIPVKGEDIKPDEFEAGLNALYEAEVNQKAEVKLQGEIEREWSAAQAKQDEEGRQKAYKLAQEEQKRLADMKKQVETQKIQKRTTISTKKSTR